MRMSRLLIAILCLLGCSAAMAEIVVVVDARAGITQLTKNEVINIFLGRYRKLPDGSAAQPIESSTGSIRADFYRGLVDKDISEINAYWARLYFSGKTSPPQQVLSTTEVVAEVLAHSGGISYIDRKDVDNRLRVVLSLKP